MRCTGSGNQKSSEETIGYHLSCFVGGVVVDFTLHGCGTNNIAELRLAYVIHTS